MWEGGVGVGAGGVQSLVPARGLDPLPVRQQYSQLRTTGLETGVVKREKKAPKVKAGLGLHVSTKHQATKKKKKASNLWAD